MTGTRFSARTGSSTRHEEAGKGFHRTRAPARSQDVLLWPPGRSFIENGYGLAWQGVRIMALGRDLTVTGLAR